MTYARKTLSEIKLIHGDYGNFIKGQKLQKDKEKKYKTPPYQDLAASTEVEGETLNEKCWPGYEKKGMKTMFGKRYPNCVKKKKTRKENFSDWRSDLGQIDEKAVSQQQQKFFGMVRATQKGEMDNPSDEVKKAAASMTKSDVKKYASTKHDKLPKKIEEKLDSEDKPFVKKLVGKLRKGSKTHAKQADDLEKALKEEPLTKQSLDARKKAQKNVEDKMNQQDSITTVNRKNGKMTSMNFTGGARKDLFAKQLNKTGLNVKMDPDGLVPNVGATVQKQAEYGMNLARKAIKDNPSKISDKQRKDFKGADNYLKSGNIERDINRKIPGTQQYRLDIAADEVNLGSQKYKPKKKKGFIKLGIQKEDITDEALTIQDWNVDDIKFTEIEAVDIIKPKPLKPSPSNWINEIELDEGFKTRMIAKFGKKLIKNIGKVNPFTKTGAQRVTQSVSKVKKYIPPDKITSQNIQTKSVVNQAKKLVDTSKKPIKGTKPVKVDLSKPIDFDKYFGQKPPVKKVFGSKRPTGTFTDDLPPVKNPKPKKPIKDHYDWREELGEDWQKVNRNDKTDGMSQKAVNAYRKENPGSKLKTAVTKDPKKLKKGSKSAKRRLAFCRRMKGMKKKLTSAKTRRDPDSRINKALRRWNC